MIGSLTSLEQLYLKAKMHSRWRYDWLIDHEVMRKHLGRLPGLKRIAFGRDSYNFYDIDRSVAWKHYEYKVVFGGDRRMLVEHLVATGRPIRTDDDVLKGRIEIWDQTHHDQMTSEARRYMDAVKKLEWIYVGQLPIQCYRDSTDSVCPAVEREDCRELLRKMFGSEIEDLTKYHASRI